MEHPHRRHGATERGDHADDLVVYASKRKILGYTLLGAALTALGVVAWVLGPSDVTSFPFLRRVALLIAVPCMVVVTLVVVFALFSSAPRVVVSHEGIWVNWSLMSRAAPIPWGEIESLRLMVRAGSYTTKLTYLLIRLRDRQALRARQTRRQAMLWRLSGHSLVWPQEVPVVDIMLPMSAAELLGRIQARFQPELVQHGIQVQGA